MGRARLGPYLLFGLVISAAGIAMTHEGHAPLPSKGVEVDTTKGLITLSPAAHKSLAVKTTQVESRRLHQSTLAFAKLVTPWQQQHFVSSPLQGKLARIHVNSGGTVTEGQLLAELTSPELEALVLQLRTAANQHDLFSRQTERLSELDRQQLVNGREFLEIRSQLEQSRDAVQIATTKLASLGIGPAAIDQLRREDSRMNRPLFLPLYSPANGTVSHSDLAVGKVVANQEHLFEINDVSKVWVAIEVLESELANIRVGLAIGLQLAAYPSEEFQCDVRIVGDYVDPRTHTVTVWAELENPAEEPKFLPGMVGTARIEVSEDAGLLTLPGSALLGTGAERFVLVEIASTKKGFEYRRQGVELLHECSNMVQLRAGGLVLGDSVVTQGGHVLSSFFFLGSLRLSKEGIRNVGLKIDSVRRESVEEILALEGSIELPAEGVATVSTQVPGTLSTILVERGQAVSAGEVVAEVAGLPALDAQLDLLQADRDAAMLAQVLERFQATDNGRLVALRQLWDLESKLAAANHRKNAARQTLLAMGLNTEELEVLQTSGRPRATIPVRAPIAGRVVKLNKALGAGVSADEPILEIHDMRRVLASGVATEAEASRLRIGMPVRVRLLNDQDFEVPGKIVRSTRNLADDSRTLTVWIEFDEAPKRELQRHLLATLSVTQGVPEPVLAVPHSALGEDGIRSFVFVEKDDGLLERRFVRLGRKDDRFAEVLAGLSAGDRIAVQGVAELSTTFASVR